MHEFDVNKTQYVHSKCRKKHTDPRQLEQMRKRKYEDEISPVHKLRSEVKAFCFHTDCYLCGSYVDQEKAKKYPKMLEYEFSKVMCLQVKETMRDICMKRNDEWAAIVSCRLSCINDLPAEEAIYHRKCF